MAKSVNGKLKSKSISRVEHEGQEYITQQAIEDILLPVNEAKIQASANTPFMQSPLVDEFGYKANRPAHDQVLKGTFITPQECSPATDILIKGLVSPSTQINQGTFHPRKVVTTNDHIRCWKKQKERTAGGMPGFHFGHYKAHIQRRRLTAFDASQRSMAYTTGYSYKQWKKGLDAQLLKRSKDYNAKILLTILLLEPDFNTNDKVLGSDAMQASMHLQA
jgi:hypothetical protein